MLAEGSKERQRGLLSQVQHYWHILLKWKWTAIIFFAIAVISAVLYSFLVTPVYTANGTLWIEDNPNILPFEEVQSLGAGTNLSSHARLLQSRSLAWDIIDRLKLYDNPDFAGRERKSIKRPDPANPVYREILVQHFLNNIGVSSTDRSRLVDVTFSSRDPKLAADVLNALFEGYMNMIVKKNYSASEQATDFLNKEIADLRIAIEQKERELNKYGSEKDILPLTATEAPTITKIRDVNNALTTATLDKVNKLNYYNQLKNAPLGSIPSVPEGSLILRLREQYVALGRQYAARLATVKPEYPEMQRLKTELESATEDLKKETENLTRNAYSEYLAALRQEQSLQKLLSDQKDEAYKANSSSVLYSSLRIELENKKTLLDTLSKRQSETEVSARLKGLEALNVWIVDKADYPLRPASPKRRLSILLGMLFGLVGGTGLALGLEYLNNTVKTSRDVSVVVGLPMLGAVPAFEAEAWPGSPKTEFERIRSLIAAGGERKEGKVRPARRKVSSKEPRGEANGRIELIVLREPQSIQAESYRSIRTTLLVSAPPGRIKTVLFTSPLAKEGKSSTVSNLAISLAESNKQVVIVDSDLRKPRLAKIFGTNGGYGPGLSGFLSSQLEPSAILSQTTIPNLQIISSGPLPINPIELLTSEKMDSLVAYLKRGFDFVLFDTPPILAVSDALAMAPMADAIVMVARGGQTPLPALRLAKQRLDAHKLRCFGVILNSVDLIEQDGYYAREYYHY